ncbi:DUF6702 family protein [Mucilaginibacter pedocola]|uniref:Uncharacterized protein n=1 Tax=Mucilaginibacter pedocola TaxID=1792845 RepID=A0A1S9PG58_9SPHI|nr:DUF6702 family protein [Mucilaginibacter pedocola]OOQ59936.1 hypothetical protein BC343_27670 [Mucilaginibacter pedocola]
MAALLGKPLLYCYILLNSFWATKPAPVAFHPLHVSTTDVSYNAKDGQMEVILTIFTDDMESALAKQFNTRTDLTKPDQHAAMDELIKKYVSAHLQLKTGGAALPLNYLGYEINKEAINVYLESAKITAPKKIDADVTLLRNLYDDQLNIVHMTVGGVRKSGRLDPPDRKIAQEFN